MNKRIRHGYIQQRSYEWNAHRTRATTFVRTTSVAHMHATGMHAEESTRACGPTQRPQSNLGRSNSTSPIEF